MAAAAVATATSGVVERVEGGIERAGSAIASSVRSAAVRAGRRRVRLDERHEPFDRARADDGESRDRCLARHRVVAGKVGDERVDLFGGGSLDGHGEVETQTAGHPRAPGRLKPYEP